MVQAVQLMVGHTVHAWAPVASADALALLCGEDTRWKEDTVCEMARDGRQERVMAEDIQFHSGDGVKDVTLLVVQEVHHYAMRATAEVDLVEEPKVHPRRPKA